MELSVTYQNERYPGLYKLDYLRRWLDGFISIAEGYLMTFSTILITIGISFSMYDFLTNGQALNDPNIFRAWAIVQTVAIDAQLINMWFRLKVAIRERRYGLILIYGFLGLLLAFVTFGASSIPAIQKSLGMTFDQAVLSAGIPPVWMIYARSFVAILLAIIGAFQRTVVHFEKSGTVKNMAISEQEPEPIEDVAESEREPGFFAEKWQKLVFGWVIKGFRENKKEFTEDEKEDEQNTDTETLPNVSEAPTEGIEPPPLEKTTEPLLTSVKPPVRASQGRRKNVKRIRGNGLLLIQKELEKNPQANNATICRNTGLSASYVSTARARLANAEEKEQIAS